MDSGPRPPNPTDYAAQLYEEHSKSVLALFQHNRRMSADHALDLLQQTFEELIGNLQRDPSLDIERPRQYLLTIAHRQFCKYVERRDRETKRKARLERHQAESTDDDLTDLGAAIRDEQRLILRGLRRLGANNRFQHQMILYLRFFVGLTQEATAEVLELPRATISRRQQRAITLLRDTVAELSTPDDPAAATSTTIINEWHDALLNEAKQLMEGPEQDGTGQETA